MPNQATPRPENYALQRTFCGVKFSNGLMCPQLYTELGGKCSYNGTEATCTDVRRLASRNLRRGQLGIVRLLGLFDLVARKHNITYWLSSGTLIGAVRHKGFIPWDADADIEIPLDQYEKFFKSKASRDLPSDVFFQNSESDPHLRPLNPAEYQRMKYKDIGLYKRTWNPRLRDRNSCYKYCMIHGCKWHDGLMMDMFVIDPVPDGTYPLKEYLFEGLRFPVQNNWKEAIIDEFGEDFMDIPEEGSKNRFHQYQPDPLHSCDELMKRNIDQKYNLK
ncbi:hypothetical protein QZH41_002681 [Actinostola sp. cb2023]|nr:hypothetical protein QZH41_002681 [Actinostola sp. cb2023]